MTQVPDRRMNPFESMLAEVISAAEAEDAIEPSGPGYSRAYIPVTTATLGQARGSASCLLARRAIHARVVC